MDDDLGSSRDRRPLKIIAGADSLGASLKDSLVSHLRSLNIEVEDLPTDTYYSVGQQVGRLVSSSPPGTEGRRLNRTKGCSRRLTVYENAIFSLRKLATFYKLQVQNVNTGSARAGTTRGILACGTGVGVSIFANKFPGFYAAVCLSPGEARNARSINGCNVLALSGTATLPDSAVEIVDSWLDTPFKVPCPASESVPWPDDIVSFLDGSVKELSTIGSRPEVADTTAIRSLNGSQDFIPIDVFPGGSMKILRETPTSAIARLKAGSVEPAHHHTFGYDLVVLKGSKSLWNLTKKEKHVVRVGDYIFIPARDVHRVKYFEDTEFFIKWDGHWDVLMDEDFDTANAAIDKVVI